jgi:hypothetical protein
LRQQPVGRVERERGDAGRAARAAARRQALVVEADAGVMDGLRRGLAEVSVAPDRDQALAGAGRVPPWVVDDGRRRPGAGPAPAAKAVSRASR